MNRAIVMVGVVAGGALVGGGCASREKQLQRVARDWAMTIRASQVIPVYPMTEDLVPGDMFLVETSIHKQAKMYREEGYLPLDNYVGRLHGLDYPGFYRDAYWSGTFAPAPHARPMRQRAPDPNSSNGANQSEVKFGFRALAPRAAFPTYTVSVKGSGGFSAALPIQGVPVAMSLVNARSATASVTINDAYTYGIDPEDLVSRLYDWTNQDHIKTHLGALAKANSRDIFVRVVQRVYLAGGVMVSIDTQRATGFKGSAGDEKPVNLLLDLDEGDEGTTGLERLNSSLQSTVDGVRLPAGESLLPGGTLKAVQVTSRSVVMNESFDRPLVVGYLGYDFPIEKNGTLGVPIATLDQLKGREVLKKGRPRPTMGDPPDSSQRALNELESRLARMLASDDPAVWGGASRAIDMAQQRLGTFGAALGESVTLPRSSHEERLTLLDQEGDGASAAKRSAGKELRVLMSDISAMASVEDPIVARQRRDAAIDILRQSLRDATADAMGGGDIGE